MNIVLSDVQYKEISIPNCLQSMFDNEALLYFVEDNQIVVMNETATCIWTFINDCVVGNNSEAEITVHAIFNHLKSEFEMDVEMRNEVIYDIEEIVKTFVERRMVLCHL